MGLRCEMASEDSDWSSLVSPLPNWNGIRPTEVTSDFTEELEGNLIYVR
jgi:hypothetical protein